jgi:hypothetical protein
LLGAALMAVAIFVPQKPVAKIAPRLAVVTTHSVISTWVQAPAYDLAAPVPVPEPATVEVAATAAPMSWPALVDPRATDCDAHARRQIAQALGALGEDWCAGIVARALAEETDADVRSALSEAFATG